MANVIKKAIIPKNLLTELDWESDGYLVRYRIKSENKNLSSHWSQVYLVPVSSFPQVEGSYSFVSGEDEKTIANVVWDDLAERPAYDIFTSFRGITTFNNFEYDEDVFFYHGTSQTHNYSFVYPEGSTSLRIVIQPAADKKLIKQNFVIYDSDPQNAVYES